MPRRALGLGSGRRLAVGLGLRDGGSVEVEGNGEDSGKVYRIRDQDSVEG